MYATVQGLCYYSVSSTADPTCEESPSVVFSTTPSVVFSTTPLVNSVTKFCVTEISIEEYVFSMLKTSMFGSVAETIRLPKSYR